MSKLSYPEYLTMWTVIIENELYLSDKYNNIYTFDEIKPKYIGKMTLDRKINNKIPINYIEIYHDSDDKSNEENENKSKCKSKNKTNQILLSNNHPVLSDKFYDFNKIEKINIEVKETKDNKNNKKILTRILLIISIIINLYLVFKFVLCLLKYNNI